MLNDDRFRRDIEAFSQLLMREYYLHFSGQKDTFEIARIFDDFKDLYDNMSINYLKERADTSPAHRKMLTFSMGLKISSYVKELNEKLENEVASSNIEIEGKEIPYYQSYVIMENTKERKRRKEIYEKRLEVIKHTNDLRKDIWTKIYEVEKHYGYENYYQMNVALQEIDFKKILNKLEIFLDKTEEEYLDGMDKLIRKRAKVNIEDAQPHDISYLFRGKEFDKYFPSEKLIPVIKKFLDGLGINLEDYTNIHIDIEPRPRKNPRAFCAPVRIPDEIYLNHLPTGGHSDYSTTMHELGHTLHFANTDRKLPAEDKYFGDMGLSEIYAFLLQYLTINPLWVKDFISKEVPDEYFALKRLEKIFIIRRYLGKLMYEIKLHQDEDIDSGWQYYEKHLKGTTGINYPPIMYLDDMDDEFYSASYLRAWFAEAQLEHKLKKEFGKKWWLKKETGEFLKKLWELGEKPKIEVLLKELGEKGINPKILIRQLKNSK